MSGTFSKRGIGNSAETYRRPMAVSEIRLHCDHYAYPVCPRCRATLEREYQAYCDRCGQALNWRHFNRAFVVRID